MDPFRQPRAQRRHAAMQAGTADRHIAPDPVQQRCRGDQGAAGLDQYRQHAKLLRREVHHHAIPAEQPGFQPVRPKAPTWGHFDLWQSNQFTDVHARLRAPPTQLYIGKIRARYWRQ